MNGRIAARIAVLFLVFGVIYSCKPEAKTNHAELILGRWDIQEATRNGKPTESLAELYFEFFEDGSMRTNLSGTAEQAKYEISDSKISQRDSPLEADYVIESLVDSTLLLSTELRGFNFRFLLVKSIQEE